MIGVPQYRKAFICPFVGGRPDGSKKFFVPFNPSELSIEEGIGASDMDDDDFTEKLRRLMKGNKVGLQRPPETDRSNSRKSRSSLSTTLFFNTLNDLHQDSYEDVRDYIRQLEQYTNQNMGQSQPPQEIYFGWGSIGMAGLLTRMSVRYTMFAPDGKPVRAQVDITITGMDVAEKAKVLNGVAAGTLSGLGSGDTGLVMPVDPSMWRNVCRAGANPRLL